MKIHYLLSLLFVFALLLPAVAQDEEEEEEQLKEGWNYGLGFGTDFSQLLQINPRQGAGQNSIGFGGAVNVFGKYRKNRFAWDNVGSLQFSVQRFGSGPLPSGQDIPFQKAIDELRFASKAGYATSPDSKFYYAADLAFLSQLTPTYFGTEAYPGNFLSDVSGDGMPNSKFFSPATINFSLGIDYKPNDNLSIFFSPLASKFIVVADDNIAALGIHGNPVERDADGNVTSFENVFYGFGASARITYANKFLNDKLLFTSNLLLFSNYLENPQNIDIDWTNELAYSLFKGFQIALTANIFYDDDVLVQVTDFDAPGGVEVRPNGDPRLSKRVSFTQQLLIKYNINF